jgi:DNA-binding response OmpR family regulator
MQPRFTLNACERNDDRRHGQRLARDIPRTEHAPACLYPCVVSAIHVLVVDDDPAVGYYVCQVLRGAGYEVSEAAGLDQATVVANGSKVHLLLSDVVLGAVDGLDIEEAVRGIQPAVKTLFMSGYARPRYGTATQDPVLVKPFAAAELLERVDALVGSATD